VLLRHLADTGTVLIVEVQLGDTDPTPTPADTSGVTAFPQWPDALVSLLKQIPARDFAAVSESCLMVSPNSGQARARPGCPIG
jgi:hypothetical protein